MGKGGGCVPSKKKFPKRTTVDDDLELPESAAAEPADEALAAIRSDHQPRNLKLFIVFYSMYGHVEGLALRMKRGADSVAGVEAVLYRVPETLTEEALVKMQGPPKDGSVPEIGSPAELAGADGFLFGFPTRYGSMAAQMKAFFDSTGELWREQKLSGKPAGFFVSTGTQGGGQETTAMDSVRGGSPYGAGVFAGDGTREPSETELALAEHHGKYMAAIVKRLAQP